mgnify:CR=1 FL=1
MIVFLPRVGDFIATGDPLFQVHGARGRIDEGGGVGIGGGEGAFLTALAKRFPGPKLTVFDLPSVAERAASRFAAAGLGARAQAIGGDFFRDPLPAGHDAVTLVRVVHDHDDDKVQQLFLRIRAMLPPGGRLIIAEPMSGARDSARVADVYFAFYLLAMGSGRPRTFKTLARMLRAAGFSGVAPIATARPMLVSIAISNT